MTFILNVLHKDFSLLLADNKANANGPTTIKMGNITINAAQGATIFGFQKIYLNRPNTLAVGIAGTIQDHKYITKVGEDEDINESLKKIRSHMEEYLKIDNRTEVMQKESRMENQSIATFFDSHSAAYFSNIYLFSDIHNATRLYCAHSAGARLIHVGSGSNVFEKAVGLQEIQKFTGSVTSIDNVDNYFSWIKEAFAKVSALDSRVSKDVVGWLSTRGNPIFIKIESGQQ
jgi:hypothetical protein